MKRKMNWREYELVAEKIYRKLEPTAVVKHNDLIYGHDTKVERQIDVSIRNQIGGHEILVIVQVRDRKRAPDVNSIGEFASVIRDVRAHRGVMICRKPPGQAAINLAAASGIDLCTAIDASDHNWADDMTIPVIVSLIEGELHPDLTFASKSGFNICLPPKPSPGLVSTDEGETRCTLFEYMNQQVTHGDHLSPGTHELAIKDDRLRILLNETDWVPLPHLLITATLRVRKLFRQCPASEYLAIHNYSTGKLSIAELKVELPPFDNSDSWRDGANMDLYQQVTETFPIVDLRLSRLSQDGKIGFRLLPLSDIAIC